MPKLLKSQFLLFLLNLNKQFLDRKEFTDIERQLELFANTVGDSKVYETVPLGLELGPDGKDSQSLINYLVYMESLAAIIQQDVMHLGIVDDLFVYRFFLAINNPIVQKEELLSFAPYYQGCYKLAATWSKKLRKQKSVAQELQVFIFTNRHREDRPQHFECAQVQFDTATDSTLEIVKAATDALKRIYRNGYGYKKSGVRLSRITPSSAVQGTLFDTVDRPKHKKLMAAIDRINNQIGRESVKLVSQGTITGHTNREHLSPQYTTRWDEILVVKV